MKNLINQDTNLTLDVKTLILIIGFVVSMVSMYAKLQADINLAMEKPEPEISRVEYDLKDTNIRDAIYNIQKQVQDNSEKLDKLLFNEISK
tara:strand:- start:134 stop:406 length:273 start_codon:yes stop_codon:yes gene_type:complete